jgi:hypothetical protein
VRPAHLARSKVVIYEVLTQQSPEIVRTFPKLQSALDWLLGEQAGDFASRSS